MNQQSTLEQLQELKLTGMAKRYEAIIKQPVQQQPEPHTIIGLLTEAEAGYRVHQRTQLYLRLSKLRYNASPEQINCTPGRGIRKPANYRFHRLREKLLRLCNGKKRLFAWTPDDILFYEPFC